MNMYRLSFLISLLLLTAAVDMAAQNNEPVLLRAMKDELKRNADRLCLEGVNAPFFISYQVKDAHQISINATAGAITSIDTSHDRKHTVRVLVGDYQQTQEHYLSGNLRFSFNNSDASLPLEDDYDGIRRELWLSTDRAYKSATEQFEKKRAALRQQQMPEEYKDIADFTRVEAVTRIAEPQMLRCDIPTSEARIRRLSAILAGSPAIYSSQVSLNIANVMVYYVNSEGSVVVQPRTLTSFLATAATQADDGEPLVDFIVHHSLLPDGLPDEEALSNELRTMARTLIERRDAPGMDDNYTGPVLFLDQAVPELLTRLYLGEEGLIASRTPVMEGPMAMLGAKMRKRNLGDKLDKRVLPVSIGMFSTPLLREFDGQALTGAFAIDAEGVVPPNELALVKEGRVHSLLSSRTPTPHSPASTGHYCIGVGGGLDGISPGVLDVRTSAGPESHAMKALLLEKARDEGLPYAYIVRRIRPDIIPTPSLDDDLTTRISLFGMSGATGASPLGQVTRIFRVNVEDGSEIPVRSVEVLKPGSSALQRLKASTDRMPWNTLLEGESPLPGLGSFISIGRSVAGLMGGLPVSIIAPKAVLIEDMEVRTEKRPITPKPPIVQSPLAE
jgi:predicted Zn-dependent protease